ncbi:TPA: 4Fe-4S ferredoxin [candidate division CPR2 bacterium]|uniref:4Fe-4S ferredoxin iron-sulfur binding domain-containing protein n=1 Tax=candidate division CPR2 bacterium GW2011_GWC1_41_48 TaxID=1618344 RepID=A0A0G0Z7W3_UNCC2|nr:MAG: 4Fe-4S ferredoxin iron-sulfur binding domain-containing protein [candidate division CPR2 bacterium GW2011_GWC2_39_35]KKR27258.1 MAG: 4Fe-4S ferredoxin iron-sulfur binding domain-containing protein [candidate division CPR2 bacterium GW2011_GWD2_39_7]KKS09098.1 MAG: 4Fe-4S ferredoxin iron-sulfur binding domain-containing protein [candidate division CPR2 bacterium GW2011_GWC1_41_48]OGB73177.1 MAG: hypothetical protein A2Y26_00905 [candidate division CPR2 bacterium GWD2_39_7]HBG81829.1 4Fe-
MPKPVTFESSDKKWTIDLDQCKGCGVCVEKCPQKCLNFSHDNVGFYLTPAVDCDISKCIACKICDLFCPDCAIGVEKKVG